MFSFYLWPIAFVCSTIVTLAKILPGFLLLLFAASVSVGDLSFAPSSGQAIAQEKTKSYQHFTLTKKSDATSQVRHLLPVEATFQQTPSILVSLLPQRRALSFDDFVLQVLSIDIPPPA